MGLEHSSQRKPIVSNIPPHHIVLEGQARFLHIGLDVCPVRRPHLQSVNIGVYHPNGEPRLNGLLAEMDFHGLTQLRYVISQHRSHRVALQFGV